MNGKMNVQGYYEYIKMPWGKLFYELAWHNIKCQGKRILDFGSGFGYTADHFAESNEVTAVEPNEEMIKNRFSENEYRQITGDINVLKQMPDHSFDVIICHNVLEYIENREELMLEFGRLLAEDGFISIIKHNKTGKIMQKAVFEYNIDEAMKLLDNENIDSANFGTINEYGDHELEEFSRKSLKIDRIYGLRIFYALQRNELKTGEEWFENMYKLECKAEEIPEFRDIAFFHHVILSRNKDYSVK
jgi:SAM-dependent methyltransferase